MAGPAIRNWGFARSLSKVCDVTLLTPNEDHPLGDGFKVTCHKGDDRIVRVLADSHDVILFQGYALAHFPSIAKSGKPLVVDLYDPFTLETLHINSHREIEDRVRANRADLNVLTLQIAIGDFFVCGHQRQLDFWLGMLSAANRLNPQNSDADPTFRKLIDVVPFGVPPKKARHTRQVLKGVHPGISKTDKVVMWIGGIWDWFDPLTPIRAAYLLAQERPDVKLVFLGVKSPDPAVPAMQMHRAAVQLSKELNVHDTSVFFMDWVPYEDMQNYLLEADIGTYSHLDHLETHYSIRTRVFDYIWARLPMVISAGDYMGEMAESAGVAKTYPIGDAEGMAKAILSVLDTPNLRAAWSERFDPLLDGLAWEKVTRPLLDYCANPTRAPDNQKPYSEILANATSMGELAPAWQLPMKTIRYIQRNGTSGLAIEIRNSLRRRGLLR